METVWNILNSPAVIAAIAALLVWGLNRLYAAKPAWQKYEGAIISAIKYAEKAIPDDSDNKAVQRINAALQYAVTIIQEREGRPLKDAEVASLKDAIAVKHDVLDAEGTLTGNG